MISNYSIHHTKLFFGFIRLEYSKQTKWTAFMLLVLLRSLTVMVTIKNIYILYTQIFFNENILVLDDYLK